MTVLKKLMIVTALFAGGSSFAMAQNGLPTGGYPPVMGGAGGNPAVPGTAYYPEGMPGPNYATSGTAYHHPDQAPQKDLHVSKVTAVEGALKTRLLPQGKARHERGH